MWRSIGKKRGNGGIISKTRVISLPQERPNDEVQGNIGVQMTGRNHT